jgi:hypothetical protein
MSSKYKWAKIIERSDKQKSELAALERKMTKSKAKKKVFREVNFNLI